MENPYYTPFTNKSACSKISGFVCKFILQKTEYIIDNDISDDTFNMLEFYSLAELNSGDKLKKKNYASFDYKAKSAIAWIVYKFIQESTSMKVLMSDSHNSELCHNASYNNEYDITNFMINIVDSYDIGKKLDSDYFEFDKFLERKLKTIIEDETLNKCVISLLCKFIKIIGYNLANLMYSYEHKQKQVNLRMIHTVLRNLDEPKLNLDPQIFDDLNQFVLIHNENINNVKK